MLSKAPAALVESLRAQREAIVDEMEAAARVTQGSGMPPETRQYLAGYLDLVTAAAEGNLEPRDAYLETVIPGIKQGGMTLEFVLSGMVSTTMALSAVVSKDFLPWHYQFACEYTQQLVAQWQKA